MKMNQVGQIGRLAISLVRERIPGSHVSSRVSKKPSQDPKEVCDLENIWYLGHLRSCS
uniref:Uncharacterized protein n=1 Tax=Anguilla anguilla TaxID=7936 RepID=A0A0E9XYB9_ANGAN